ncbi:MAG: DUF3237 domain-containing protein [Novosphingobium sp.]
MAWKSAVRLFAAWLLALMAAPAQAAAPAPTLAYAFSMRIELLPPIEQGEVDGARQRFIPITGGAITGPRLTGTVLPGGGDWQQIHPGGLAVVHARYHLKAADGTVIAIDNQGVRVASAEVTEQLAKGVDVDPAAYYFRTTPVFAVAEGPHAWLRRSTFVARGIRRPDHVMIDVYIVE